MIRASNKYDQFKAQMKEEENPMIGLLNLSDNVSDIMSASRKISMGSMAPIEYVDSNAVKAKELKNFLERAYATLTQMKKDFLRGDS
jgi:hypothetical protein